MWNYILAGGVFIYGIWAVNSSKKEKEEKIKKCECKKCKANSRNGIGVLFEYDNSQRLATYKCDFCTSTWVKRII